MIRKIIKFIISVFICEMAGFLGSFFTAPAIPVWYAQIQKPFFNPPSWLFAPAWALLFFLMGISLYLIWVKSSEGKNIRTAVFAFLIQFILNILWSFAFFGLRSPISGFIVIIFLWFAILFTILKFYSISKESAYTLIPYIIWVTFAAILNFSILVLN